MSEGGFVVHKYILATQTNRMLALIDEDYLKFSVFWRVKKTSPNIPPLTERMVLFGPRPYVMK
jgi:hypothetical protein